MEISPRNYKRKIDYNDFDNQNNIKYQKLDKCFSNIENNTFKSYCQHQINIECMEYQEIINLIYYGKFECKVCHSHYNNFKHLVHSKKDMLELVDMYFSIFKILLKQTKLVNRDYYEYKEVYFIL